MDTASRPARQPRISWLKPQKKIRLFRLQKKKNETLVCTRKTSMLGNTYNPGKWCSYLLGGFKWAVSGADIVGSLFLTVTVSYWIGLPAPAPVR